MRTTHTCAELPVSQSTFNEVLEYLRALGPEYFYHYTFCTAMDQTPNSIDMTGLALVVKPPEPAQGVCTCESFNPLPSEVKGFSDRCRDCGGTQPPIQKATPPSKLAEANIKALHEGGEEFPQL